MTFPESETQKTVYTVLAGDSALQTLLGATTGAPKVYDMVPDNVVFPYIEMVIAPLQDRGNEILEGVAIAPIIHVYTRGRGFKQCQAIQERIDTLLHDIDHCIEGWNIISFRRATRNIIKEPDNVTLHGVQQFNVLLGEA